MPLKVKKVLTETLLTLGFLTLFMTAYNLYQQKDMPSYSAPELKAQTITKVPFDLYQASHEKPVLLYFWASWCQVCSWVSPSISDLSEDYQVVTVAISSGVDGKVSKYLETKQLKFDVINDPAGELSRAWQVGITPSIFLISKGKVEFITTGFTTKLGLLLRLWYNTLKE